MNTMKNLFILIAIVLIIISGCFNNKSNITYQSNLKNLALISVQFPGSTTSQIKKVILPYTYTNIVNKFTLYLDVYENGQKVNGIASKRRLKFDNINNGYFALLIAEPITYEGQAYTFFSIELDGDITNLAIKCKNPLNFNQIVYAKTINSLDVGKEYPIVVYISSNNIVPRKLLSDFNALNNYIKKCKSAFVLRISLSKSKLK